jgi:transcriptional regulator with GAF, ATPase, and Fis domain
VKDGFMDKISPTLLNDTLKLVQLARETAKLQGSKQQAEKLEPVVEKLQTLVNNDKTPKPSASAGILGQSDFQTMLNVSRNTKPAVQAESGSSSSSSAVSSSSIEDRNRMVGAMTAGGMNDVDIARQLGMTRDEVRMVINISNIGNKR